MIWYIIAAVSAVVAIGLAIKNWSRDRRQLRARASEVMREELRQELEEEAEAIHARAEKFKTALRQAQGAAKTLTREE
ncbi:MAG: hypothetical protein HY465_02325 [Deltaproteobacteria bacterium]|nr:hypothetical protein [Deltaproteobacteria bacterium]